ncbi:MULTISPECIES: nuclear transport factor 2 family protein [unclassified Mesorhizobium]|uniref:nuclear transport factor 2 family protein n=1 Tax=unclassified Mesorhizobium TaxID=325217 RepID=UPI003015160C
MRIKLPKPIADYFEADKDRDAEAVARCFIYGAIVRDEGHAYVGQDSIRRWKAGASKKYTYTVEPLMLGSEGFRIVVTSHVVGDFPGSPVDLRYFFILNGEQIAELEIVL